MSPRRKRSRRGRPRSKRSRHRRRRLRRALLGAGAVLAGLAIAVAIGGGQALERTIREVTLPLRHDDVIRQQAADKDVPADMIASVIYNESRFRDQTSHAGARGLMQITPRTAKAIEELSGGTTFEIEDLADPDLNIRYGTFYLRYLLEKFEGNEVAALAAYNAGETNVAAWGGAELELDDIRFSETRHYVANVLEKRDDYRRAYADELGL